MEIYNEHRKEKNVATYNKDKPRQVYEHKLRDKYRAEKKGKTENRGTGCEDKKSSVEHHENGLTGVNEVLHRQTLINTQAK